MYTALEVYDSLWEVWHSFESIAISGKNDSPCEVLTVSQGSSTCEILLIVESVADYRPREV